MLKKSSKYLNTANMQKKISPPTKMKKGPPLLIISPYSTVTESRTGYYKNSVLFTSAT